jgi:hypothetical protein
MLKSKLLVVLIAASAALLFVATDMASAAKKAKKVSYEEAWEICRKDVQANLPGMDFASTRATRGAACLKRYGYRLKKGANF